MTESARADALPELPSQQQKGRRRATRRIINGVMFVALTAGVFGLLPRLGGLTSLVSTVALLGLFLAGFAATAGRHLSRGYLIIAGIALALVGLVAAIALMVGAHPPVSLSEPGAGRPCGRGTSGPASIQSKWPGPASVLRRSPGRR